MEEPVSFYPFSPKEYPGKIPNYSYFLSKDLVHEIHIANNVALSKAVVDYKGRKIELSSLVEKLSVEQLEDRYGIIGYGSNGCPSRLIEKGIFNLPIVRAFAKDIDVVYTYEKTRYEVIPATIVKSSNTLAEIWVSFLDDDQRKKMDESEGRMQEHYDLVQLKNCLTTLPNGQVLSPAYAYVANRKGIALKDNKPIACTFIQAKNRKFETMNEREILKAISECEKGEPVIYSDFKVTPLQKSPQKFEEKPFEILNEFSAIYRKLPKPPNRKSNKRFIGRLFAEIIGKKTERYVSPQYKIVLGPLWVRNLEWVEWDAAIVKKGSVRVIDTLFRSRDVIALFELKTRGIYGRKYPDKGKTVQEVVTDIKKNFLLAMKHCSDLKRCFYVSLQERLPKRKAAINYYEQTKRLEPEVVTCILFRSPITKQPIVPYANEWNKLIEELRQL